MDSEICNVLIALGKYAIPDDSDFCEFSVE